MLPPSDSDEESDDTPAPAKGKSAQVSLITSQTATAACYSYCKAPAMRYMQPATAGMLPPSDSDDESSEEEEVKPKPKASSAPKPPKPAVAPAPKKYALSVVQHQILSNMNMPGSTLRQCILFILCLPCQVALLHSLYIRKGCCYAAAGRTKMRLILNRSGRTWSDSS